VTWAGTTPSPITPVDANVGWIGIDGYSCGVGKHPELVGLGNATRGVRIARASGANRVLPPPRSRAVWWISPPNRLVTHFFDYTLAAGARMVIWFNEDKETDTSPPNRLVTRLFDYTLAAGARMVIWFNEDKETDSGRQQWR
jgi:hypothetical protein